MTFKGCTPTFLVNALGIAPGADGAVPAEIQWMPPGRHEICASKGGKPAKLTVSVDSGVAAAVAKSFDDLVKAGKRPYLDFNHAGGASSGRVTAVRWAGDDPVKGGIRVTVEWSDEGAKAITGRTYFSFSPTFLVDAAGKVIGTTANMGGLVNEPAFTAIAPVAASESSHEQPTTTMKKLLQALATAKLIPNADMEEDAACAAFADAMKKKSDAEVKCSERITALESEVKAAAKTRAEGLVDAAAREGRIPPKDTKTREYWVNSIVTAGAPAEEALKAMPVNAALAVQARETKPEKTATGDKSAEQNRVVGEYRAKNAGSSYAEAWTACASENPELFSEKVR